MELTCTINGNPIHLADVPADLLLIDLLREHLGLTGTKRGCDTGVCGACSVLVDDKLTKSCRTPVSKLVGRRIETIEGLTPPDGSLSDMQAAFLETGAVQCGFCTPGMVVAGEALLRKTLTPTRDEIRTAINPNLCRCTGYQHIIDAIELTAQQRAGKEA